MLKPLHDDHVQYSPGENATLSCQLSPEVSAVPMEIMWFKGEECIFLYRNGQTKERRGYEGKASLCMEELQDGKIVLNLSNIETDDAGNYVCQVIQRVPNDCVFRINYSAYAKGMTDYYVTQLKPLEIRTLLTISDSCLLTFFFFFTFFRQELCSLPRYVDSVCYVYFM